MDLSSATQMILAESAALPELTRVTRYVHDEATAGRRVSPKNVRWVLREAGLAGVIDVVGRKHGTNTAKDIVLAMEREIGRPLQTADR